MSGEVFGLDVDRGRCALCEGPNDCIMARRAGGERVEDPCWCVSRVFPAGLLERATARDGGTRCVCEACLEGATSADGP